MTRKRPKSADRTSFGTLGTTETLGALRSPSVASGELSAVCYRLPRSTAHPGECRLISHNSTNQTANVAKCFVVLSFAPSTVKLSSSARC